MIKINFRNKEISKLEAETLIQNLKTELISPNLSEQEQKRYKNLKNAMGYLNSISGKTRKLSEREYLIIELKSRIELAELREKIKYCEQHGHIPNHEHISAGQSGTKLYGECKRCGIDYNRPLISKEWEYFDKSMRTPMTI